MKTLTTAIISLVLGGMALYGQEGTPVNVSDGSPLIGYQKVLKYSGTNLIAVCFARSVVTTGLRAATQVSISAISKASPAVVTSTGHGFDLNTNPLVTISGATGTGWVTGINGTFVAVPVDANSFSLYTTAGVAVDSSGFGTLAGTVVFTTTAPRYGMPEWAVQLFSYDGSNNLINVRWLGGSSSLGAKCSQSGTANLNAQ